jgi:hypothetical protein
MTESAQPQPADNGDEQLSPADLIGEMHSLRQRTRTDRRAYWLPLLVFGVLIAASVPLYVRSLPRCYTPPALAGSAMPILGSVPSSLYVGSHWIGAYWFVAMQVGIVATVLWYRWRGRQVGLRTPTSGFLIASVAVIELALLASVVSQFGLPIAQFRGMFPLVLLAVPVCVLAWMERSIALAAIAAVYVTLALLACLYNVENILARLGWYPGGTLAMLPNVALPALFLVLAGSGAWLAPRLRWRLRRLPANG